MNAFLRKLILGSGIGMMLVPLSSSATVDGLQDRPVRIVVPYVAGGTPDVIGRIISAELSSRLKRPVVVENRAGAGGSIGAQAVMQAPADGHTLLMCSFPCTTAKWLYQKPPYDVTRDFEPVIKLVTVPSVLVAHPSVPAKSLQELIALAKSSPDRISAAHAGSGTSPHLAATMLSQQTGARFIQVPYKGAGAATIDLLAGNVDIFFDNLPTALPHVKSGKLRAIAVASERRSSVAPDIPTFAEAGMRDFLLAPWYGIMVAKGTLPAAIKTLNEALAATMTTPSVSGRLRDLGAEIDTGTPAEFQKFIGVESQKWGDLIKRNSITAD